MEILAGLLLIVVAVLGLADKWESVRHSWPAAKELGIWRARRIFGSRSRAPRIVGSQAKVPEQSRPE